MTEYEVDYGGKRLGCRMPKATPDPVLAALADELERWAADIRRRIGAPIKEGARSDGAPHGQDGREVAVGAAVVPELGLDA
jgi:hypothetical protein